MLDAEEYDDFVRDTVNFLAYIAEPIRGERRKIGTWVIMYLIVFFIIAVYAEETNLERRGLDPKKIQHQIISNFEEFHDGSYRQ